MQNLTNEGQRVVADAAQRHGFSQDAVAAMLMAMAAGYGNQAQFSHPEFGGMGQWSSGGMLMIGDMFNNSLKARVNALCNDLSQAVRSQPDFRMPAQSQSQSQGGPGASMVSGGSGSSMFVNGDSTWWPADLGAAGSVGSQNTLRYAYFPQARRLAISRDGKVTVYDTGEHQIGGFSQQQGGDQSLTFTSQFGTVRVNDLPIVRGEREMSGQAAAPQQPTRLTGGEPGANSGAQSAVSAGTGEILKLIEQLADLRSKGILSDSEFETKKAELLKRL